MFIWVMDYYHIHKDIQERSQSGHAFRMYPFWSLPAMGTTCEYRRIM